MKIRSCRLDASAPIRFLPSWKTSNGFSEPSPERRLRFLSRTPEIPTNHLRQLRVYGIRSIRSPVFSSTTNTLSTICPIRKNHRARIPVLMNPYLRQEKEVQRTIAELDGFPMIHSITSSLTMSMTKHTHQHITRKTGHIETHTGSTPYTPPRGGEGSPRVSVPAIPLEFWAALDPDIKNQINKTKNPPIIPERNQ